jgi:hypothetical protein
MWPRRLELTGRATDVPRAHAVLPRPLHEERGHRRLLGHTSEPHAVGCGCGQRSAQIDKEGARRSACPVAPTQPHRASSSADGGGVAVPGKAQAYWEAEFHPRWPEFTP